MSIGEIDESMAAITLITRTVTDTSKLPIPVDSVSTMNDKKDGTSTVNTVTPSVPTTNTTVTKSILLPWYRSGGMIVNLIGIVINLIVPLVILCRVPNDPLKTWEHNMNFLRVLVGAWVLALLTTTRSLNTYCIFVVPTYFVSFMVLPMILQNEQGQYTWYNVVRILFMTAILASWKINICMSVCMHRYSAHAAFKCGHYMNIGLCILSCFANQGGPLWWASQHRCHHKLRYIHVSLYCASSLKDFLRCLHATKYRLVPYLTQSFSFVFSCPLFVSLFLASIQRFCELPRDPHSPKQIGTERAFGFFLEKPSVDEEFVPQHMQFFGLRVLDTWAFAVVSFELWFAYTFLGGNIALFIAFSSGWMSQTISLWFNIANHPIVETLVDPDDTNTSYKSQCTASDDQAKLEPGVWYVPFYLLDAVVPIYSWLAMEDQHEHHHNHGNLAKRSPYDVAYWTFIKPLETLGLVWNVVVE